MKNNRHDKILFNLIGYPAMTILAILCVVPFVVIISSSVTPERLINEKGYTFWPSEISFEAYTTVFQYPADVIKAYGISTYATFVGTFLGLFLTAMTAYVLSRKDFKWRNGFSFFFYFTTLFSGGLVPWYIFLVQFLKFKENPLLAIVLPTLINVFNLLVMKNFMKTISEAIIESAKIDGAGDFMIFIKLILPLTKPALAAIGLFIALQYWNDWFLCFLFVDDKNYFSLQYYLYKMIQSVEAITKFSSLTGLNVAELPKEGMKMSMTVIATGPIIMLYPFLQRYFVKGLTIGAVKG